ncbi:MAG: thymidine kinase [Bacteroidetes bacterium]|jgi:thymidine kinase|nr:thymidine kinase [Bacteroidota bacterium]
MTGNRHAHAENGSIEVICGAMFSGKTEELIRRLKRARIARRNISLFKPMVDTRYHSADIVSHDQSRIEAQPVGHSKDVLEKVSDIGIKGIDVVGIDEAQFFDDGIVDVARELSARGIRVVVAGLDMDYLGVPFGPMPALMAVAEQVTKLHPVCMVCGGPASHSYRIVPDNNQLMLGEKESYEPRCRPCFNRGMQNP